MSQYRFPNDFWWGSAASATQTEGAAAIGGKGKNIWDYWYEQEPNRFFQQIGPAKASRFYEKYKEDIALMKQLGHNSFRLSISWSRLIPNGTGNVNQEAVAFYHQVLDELHKMGIEPFVNLYHFDMPLALQQIGGWENREVVDAFQAYARACFQLFGPKVSKWFTQNEPIVPVEAGYLYDMHYPNIIDFKRAVQVGYHSILASAKAIQAYKEERQQGKIGIILNVTPSYPRSNHPADVKAGKIADLLFNRSFLDVSVKGYFPEELVLLLDEHDLLPSTRAEDEATFSHNTIDLLGVNYYQPRRVKAKESVPHPDAPFMPEHFFDAYEMPGRKMNPYRGWEIYEKGIYDILMNLKNNYGNIECFISENGMGVENEDRFKDESGVIQDDYRITFYKDHLKWVHKALAEGVNVKGYHVWTFMDNWSWMNAYKNRYGLVAVDLNNNAKRSIKKSGWWFRDVATCQGFSDE
ncbi:6-phospho-beta-glucosidase GmuD [Virgibacillus pantothenticus]|uniref:6-phospho-beta-glucosidase n=2 Tax=Virgibacillus pantothenticus TaxID=1473 RepID=A0A0L0QUW3_VIRPA|nr:glycoside hydrolase family 1 protein [Virgibacillus pantothenticus]KNE22374.1 6-phospho-beta-glucosidase [Virgibacillus pantothenticus]MED3738342.1 glycoside hydrolase family 1 protein [Virgibacillus pantothenticus]QTY16831.1 glycoside hydrolase family 1 protein [Virgibacillus pantothenticus]SIS86483.1 aryl-phospho-beta-glucosidase [Virgibacillus pantothenticus]GIP63236.1 6-phospho-beta-glucosidase GmuD [Virgibacillus pantothenticus]